MNPVLGIETPKINIMPPTFNATFYLMNPVLGIETKMATASIAKHGSFLFNESRSRD